MAPYRLALLQVQAKNLLAQVGKSRAAVAQGFANVRQVQKGCKVSSAHAKGCLHLAFITAVPAQTDQNEL